MLPIEQTLNELFEYYFNPNTPDVRISKEALDSIFEDETMALLLTHSKYVNQKYRIFKDLKDLYDKLHPSFVRDPIKQKRVIGYMYEYRGDGLKHHGVCTACESGVDNIVFGEVQQISVSFEENSNGHFVRYDEVRDSEKTSDIECVIHGEAYIANFFDLSCTQYTKDLRSIYDILSDIFRGDLGLDDPLCVWEG